MLADWFIPGGDFVRGGSDHFDLRIFSYFFFFLLAFVFRLLVFNFLFISNSYLCHIFCCTWLKRLESVIFKHSVPELEIEFRI